MFSTFDCAVKGYRQKEDAWNAIISGFMTGGCLAARSESCFFACRLRLRWNFRGRCSQLSFSPRVTPSTFDPLLTSHPQAVQKLRLGLLLLAESYSVYSRVSGYSSVGYSQKAHDHSSLLVSPSFFSACLGHTLTRMTSSVPESMSPQTSSSPAM